MVRTVMSDSWANYSQVFFNGLGKSHKMHKRILSNVKAFQPRQSLIKLRYIFAWLIKKIAVSSDSSCYMVLANF